MSYFCSVYIIFMISKQVLKTSDSQPGKKNPIGINIFFSQFTFQGKKTFCNACKFYIYVVGFAFIILLFSSVKMLMVYFSLIERPIRYTR